MCENPEPTYPPDDCGQHNDPEHMAAKARYPRQHARPYEVNESARLERVATDQIVELPSRRVIPEGIAFAIRDEHPVDELAAKLLHAADAHHRMVEATGHDDGQWPTWYARHMLHMRPEVDW